jgi:hypothetical protein
MEGAASSRGDAGMDKEMASFERDRAGRLLKGLQLRIQTDRWLRGEGRNWSEKKADYSLVCEGDIPGKQNDSEFRSQD